MGLPPEFFYIVDKKVTPFKVSEKSLPTISDQVINQITNAKNGVLTRKNKRGRLYRNLPNNERNKGGTFGLIIPTKSYMDPVNQMALFTLIVIIISITNHNTCNGFIC